MLALQCLQSKLYATKEMSVQESSTCAQNKLLRRKKESENLTNNTRDSASK